jgi:hypothetical protein
MGIRNVLKITGRARVQRKLVKKRLVLYNTERSISARRMEVIPLTGAVFIITDNLEIELTTIHATA